MDTADTILDHLLLACGSVLPYREICSLNLLLESPVKKKSGRRSRGMKRGPVWGSPQAAGKRHPQPFSQKRLPHPRRVAQGTKPAEPFCLFCCGLLTKLKASYKESVDCCRRCCQGARLSHQRTRVPNPLAPSPSIRVPACVPQAAPHFGLLRWCWSASGELSEGANSKPSWACDGTVSHVRYGQTQHVRYGTFAVAHRRAIRPAES